MATRMSTARWQGSIVEGSGSMALGSGAYEGSFSFLSRFEDGKGTNPEELIAAAHAGCFSMAFTHILEGAGYSPRSVETSAAVRLSSVEGGFEISRIDLKTQADIPGIDGNDFAKLADAAKAGCVVSKALAAVEITLEATLV
ncbi:OsmC family protein [Amycolatopsis sp. NPDC051061]|uniref:OsmC family protein n=1 Tax=Amycolatopsis sp. NPDC051061 TaxID=3155042 RepID=UPI003445A30F